VEDPACGQSGWSQDSAADRELAMDEAGDDGALFEDICAAALNKDDCVLVDAILESSSCTVGEANRLRAAEAMSAATLGFRDEAAFTAVNMARRFWVAAQPRDRRCAASAKVSPGSFSASMDRKETIVRAGAGFDNAPM